MPITAFIEDGQVFDGCIAQVRGQSLDQPVTFRYRPADYVDLNRHYDAVAKDAALGKLGDNEREVMANIRLLEERVQSWSLGSVNAERLRRLNPVVAGRLYGIVIGTEASDPMPGGTVPETPAAATGN